ncbi:hypothetical protein CFC21_074792 [Triticum aestivum]|uniref:DUF4220 domain-containing protein n=2 Tax=Triticum aestivum TaxID=4565 RepID=A0A9R1HPC7_WHEAT|nr:hypothetical protein CFC21_074792 [Triticum aestivum]
MGLSDAMQWWDEWKLRVLVLCSLVIQFFLFFSGWVRIYHKLRRLRPLVWMAHIGGDALAIYALATLFNRQKQRTAVDGSDALELIWVPILLIHLGGQDTIAYSLENNEQWMRYAITLVSQLAVALYIFYNWWSGQKKLLQAAVLLFIIGIIKFSEKSWALKRASFNSMATRSLSVRSENRSIPPYWTLCTSDCMGFFSAKHKGEEKHHCNLSLEDYVQEAHKIVQETGRTSDQKAAIIKFTAATMDYISMMLVDRSTPYYVRLNYLQCFHQSDDEYGHKNLQVWIRNTYGALYTKQRSNKTCLGCCSWLLLPFLALASLVLFAKSDKDDYNEKDIIVSYIMFCCTVVNQLSPWLLGRCEMWCANNLAFSQDMVSQHNLMSFCAREKQLTTFKKIVAFMCPMEYINKHCYNWQETAALQIEVLIREYIKDGWKEYIGDPTAYRRFNNFRGQHTLSRHPQHLWSLKLGFDESVLVWHIATDLCFYHPDTFSQGPSGDTILRSTQISNYMIYLLYVCPEMLMAGTRQDFFTYACDEIKDILTDQNDPPSIARRIRHMKHDQLKGVVLQNAHKLAEELMEHPDEEERWKVIQGVWVEMLCYSASRCRGYLHAKSLGEGGEFLTNVWFLWSFMGMEILGDKIHQPLEKEGITDALV